MKKRIIIFILVLIFIIVGIIACINIFKKDKSNQINESSLSDRYKVEVGSDVLISNIINKKIINDQTIDTSNLGEFSYHIKYYDNKEQEQSSDVVIEVVDTTKPIVMLNDTYSVQVGFNGDLSSSIFCADNYDKNPKCDVVGEYNVDQVGEYKLKFIATDSSNNKFEKDFVLKVIEKYSTTSSVTYFDDIVKLHKQENTEIGIDVSKWQGNINWNKVRDAGATFVMIRVGYQNGYGGESRVDPYFVKNINGALNAGLKVGVYYFSYATSEDEAIEQANWIINQIKGYNVQLPVVFDWENWSSFNKQNLSIMELNKIYYSFMNTITDASYVPMLYGSKNYLEKVWHDSNKILSNTGYVWLAHYTNKTTYNGDYLMWQLCSNGRISGINGNVDINIMYK